jgi:ribosomal protein L29
MQDMSREQLELQLNETCKERLDARMRGASDKSVIHKSKKLRREIARVLTELRAREIAGRKD